MPTFVFGGRRPVIEDSRSELRRKHYGFRVGSESCSCTVGSMGKQRHLKLVRLPSDDDRGTDDRSDELSRLESLRSEIARGVDIIIDALIGSQ